MRLEPNLVLISVCLLLWACGGGSGGGDPTTGPRAIAGTWFGVGFSDDTLSLATWRLEIDATGAVTRIERDDAVLGTTGQATETMSRVYRLDLSDGTSWHMWTDAGREHAGLIRDNERTTVLERGATSLTAPYLESTILSSSWSGEAFRVDAGFAITTVVAANMVVSSEGDASGNVGATTFGPDPTPVVSPWDWDLDFGRGTTPYEDSTGGDGGLALYLSPDRRFLFAIAITDITVPMPCCDDRVYFLLTRN